MKRTVGILIGALMLLALALPAFAAEGEVTVPVTAIGKIKVEITPLDGAPAPAQTEATIDTQGELIFPAEELGEHRYEVRQVEEAGVPYDPTVWLVQVYVYLNDDEEKVSKVVTSVEDEEYKPGEIAFGVEPVTVDPPVQKKVEGNPSKKGTFTFTLTAVSNSAGYATAEMPMPEGSSGGKKTMEIVGTGEKEFGVIEFTKAGTYIYEVAEKAGSEAGYTYDKAKYTLTFTVTQVDRTLTVKEEIKNQNGAAFDICLFVNKYDKVKEKVKTFDPNKPWLWAGIAGAAVLIIIILLVIRRRRENDR